MTAEEIANLKMLKMKRNHQIEFSNSLFLIILMVLYIIDFVFLYQPDQEVPCFLILMILHSIILVYSLNLCLFYFKNVAIRDDNFMIFIWVSILIGVSIKFAALVIFSFVFTKLFTRMSELWNRGKSASSVSALIPEQLRPELDKNFKPVFITSTGALIIMLFVITLIPALEKSGVKLDYYYALLALFGLFIIGATSYEVYCANLFLKLKDAIPTSFA